MPPFIVSTQQHAVTLQRKPRLSSVLGTFALSLCLVGLSVVTPAEVHAETYVGGQFGVTFPQALSKVTLTGATVTSGTTTSDRDLQKSLVAGLKVGHYFETYRWFGLEAEVFHTSPHIKQGSLTTNEPGVGSTTTNEAGERLGMTAFAFNFLFRYPGEYFQPYFGIGPAVFRVRNTLSDSGITETLTSTSPGVNAEVGLRYLVTRHLALFGEWKFNYTQIRIKETSNFTGQNSIYQAQMFIFGIGYHF